MMDYYNMNGNYDIEKGGGIHYTSAPQPSAPPADVYMVQAAKELSMATNVERADFIKRTFSILFVQLLVTFGVVALFTLVDSVQTYVQERPGLVWLAIFLSFAFLITLGCCGDMVRTYPANYILLSCFTLCEAYLLGVVSSYYQTPSVFYAILMTLVVTLGLILYAVNTKTDFTGAGPYLLGVLLVFIVFGLVAGIACGTGDCKVVNLVYSAIGALVFSVYIVYDTQLIVGGSHKKHQFSVDDHVFAALSLYLDIINLFLYLLSLMGEKKR